MEVFAYRNGESVKKYYLAPNRPLFLDIFGRQKKTSKNKALFSIKTRDPIWFLGIYIYINICHES